MIEGNLKQQFDDCNKFDIELTFPSTNLEMYLLKVNF